MRSTAAGLRNFVLGGAMLAIAGCSGGGSGSLAPRPPVASPAAPAQFAIPPALGALLPPPPPSFTPAQPPVTTAARRTSAVHATFFSGEAALSNGVYYLALSNGTPFGYYSYLTDSNYIYHFDLGYEYVVDANDGKGGVYFYDFSTSHWWYTGRQYAFPYLYDFSLNSSLYYYPDTKNAGHYTTGPRYFYNFTQSRIVQLPGTSTIPIAPLPPPAPGGCCGTTVAKGTVKSTYSVTSTPSGLPVRVDGVGVGVTPMSTTPPDDGALHTVQISGSGAPYSVSLYQAYDGPHTITYNALGDSTGAVSIFSLQSARRATSNVLHAGALDAETVRPRQSFQGNDVVTTQVAVRYRASALRMAGRRAADIEREEGTSGIDTPTSSADPLRAVMVPAGSDATSFARRMSARAEVVAVTPVHKRRALSRSPQTVPNQFFDNYDEWYLFATGANIAWAYTTGAGAKIATIDTGVDNNIANLKSQIVFQERIVSPSDFNGNPTGAQQITNIAQDYNGHGTNIAGLALGGSSSLGFVGVAYGAQLLAFDVFPDTTTTSDAQSTTTVDEAKAIQDAVAQGADVISMSIGSPSFDSIEHDAVESAILAGVTVVAAAGNSDQGEAAGTIDYPANYPGVIAVGASTVNDNAAQQYGSIVSESVTSYSQYGPNLAVVAPGGDAASLSDPDLLHWILGYSTSTTNYAPDKCRTPFPATSCTTKFNGTSQATPQVAGTAALLISLAGGHGSLTPAQVAYLIENTADNIGDPKQGHGRLNAYRAVASLSGDTAAYSGPVARNTSPTQAIAFAYSAGGTNRPSPINQNYPSGVPIGAGGTFRMADVPPNTTYRVAVWYDANGDGYIDAGDQIGVSAQSCNSASPCNIGTITMQRVTGSYTLP